MLPLGIFLFPDMLGMWTRSLAPRMCSRDWWADWRTWSHDTGAQEQEAGAGSEIFLLATLSCSYVATSWNVDIPSRLQYLFIAEIWTCIQKKMVQSELKKNLDMIFVENVYCVFGIILKRNNCSFCCFLNHIIYFCKSRVMLFSAARQKSRLCHFSHSSKKSSWKFQQQELICEDNDERNYWGIF